MRRKLLICLMVLALIAVPLFATACEEEVVTPPEEEEVVTPPEEEEETVLPEQIIKIGISAPLTGPNAAHGLALYHANDLAAEDINAAGGVVINGVRYLFQVVAKDDRYSPDLAVENINDFVFAEHIDYVIMMSSACAGAVIDTLNKNKVMLWMQCYNDALIDQTMYPYCFRYIIPGSFKATAFFNWIKENRSVTTAVLIAPDDATGWANLEYDQVELTSLGIEVLDTIFHDREATDFMPFVTRIMDKNPDMLDCPSVPPASFALLCKQLRAAGYTGVIANTSPMTAADIVPIAGAEALEGIISCNMVLEAPLVTELGLELADRETAKYGESYGTVWELYGYLPVLAAAMERAQSIEPDAVKQMWEDTTQEWPSLIFADTTLRFGTERCIEFYGEDGIHQAYWPFPISTIQNGEDVLLALVYP